MPEKPPSGRLRVAQNESLPHGPTRTGEPSALPCILRKKDNTMTLKFQLFGGLVFLFILITALVLHLLFTLVYLVVLLGLASKHLVSLFQDSQMKDSVSSLSNGVRAPSNGDSRLWAVDLIHNVSKDVFDSVFEALIRGINC